MLVSDPKDCSNMDQSMKPIFKLLKWQLQDLMDVVFEAFVICRSHINFPGPMPSRIELKVH